MVIDKYQIDSSKLLGKGGMGKVYLGFYVEGMGDKEEKFAVK